MVSGGGPPASALEGWIAVGRVLGTYGSHGELRVQPLGRFPQRFRELRRVYVGESFAPAAVIQRRPHGQGLILRLDTVQSRDAARALYGQYLYVPEAEAVDLPEGEYFVHQIVGLEVRTAEGEVLGRVAEVLETGSNDVYVVQGPRGEVLLPATKEVIKAVDVPGGTMLVELLPGLLEGGETASGSPAPPEPGEP
ncbi:MAG TPA: ribosome maturation factor RimM [Chloroflexota bacterium]|nr:ribosome maturation factor RimM [Chloroflexota bacterium]